MADLVWSDPDPEKEDFAISPRCVLQSVMRSPRLSITPSQWSRLHLRFWRRIQVPGNQQYVAHPTSTPAMHGRVLVIVRQTLIDGMVRTQLLLSLRQFGKHIGGWSG